MTKTSLFLEDIHVGDRWSGGPIAFTEEAIIAFAEAYDPQAMHTDKAAAAAGRFGGLIASGWHVGAASMRDFVETRPFGDTPLLGLGLDELRWLKPVKPGDVLGVTREILSVEPSRSKPDRGTVRMKTTLTNQAGEVVMSYINIMQAPARPPAA